MSVCVWYKDMCFWGCEQGYVLLRLWNKDIRTISLPMDISLQWQLVQECHHYGIKLIKSKGITETIDFC